MGGHLSKFGHVEQTNEEVLRTEFGPIRGMKFKHEDKTVVGYLGIPYAKPPIGDLRFQKPEPADSWEDIMECTEYGNTCPPSGQIAKFIGQNIAYSDEATGLNLNVFAPDWKSAEFPNGLPVMVFIHGGLFEFSAASEFHDNSVSGSLPLKDIVLVTINYRVGLLGFMTTGDEHCKGNLGLWDQTLALKWVQKHIKTFGGDPGNVTVCGHGAGGASAEMLALSPHSRDLFHKVIAMSGSALCDSAVRTSSGMATICKEFAVHRGYKGGDTASLFSWYKNKPSSVLTNTIFFRKSISGFLTFSPNLDGDFFPKPFNELRKEAPKKPLMTGVCENEGLLLTTLLLYIKHTLTEEQEFVYQLQSSMKKDVIGKKSLAKAFQKEVYRFYTESVQGQTEKDFRKLAKFLGDYNINLGVLETAKASAKEGNDTYLYCFDFVNPNSFGLFQKRIPFAAATHGTELRYILGEGYYSKFEPDAEDMEMFKRMNEYVSKFAKYGDPGFPKYDLEKEETHFKISLDCCETFDVFQDGRLRFLVKVLEINKTYQQVINGVEVPDLTLTAKLVD